MMETMDIPVIKVKRSRPAETDFDDLPFGKYFSDHMLEADYADGEWKLVSIRPYQPIPLEPSIMALHYGQAIFEGIKA
ncbi:MAG TPA: branched chain amino acid aminotransferase, partial [Puia sp.]|nr:branched chain amino acid aminotransferase [Puia sp.]